MTTAPEDQKPETSQSDCTTDLTMQKEISMVLNMLKGKSTWNSMQTDLVRHALDLSLLRHASDTKSILSDPIQAMSSETLPYHPPSFSSSIHHYPQAFEYFAPLKTLPPDPLPSISEHYSYPPSISHSTLLAFPSGISPTLPTISMIHSAHSMSYPTAHPRAALGDTNFYIPTPTIPTPIPTPMIPTPTIPTPTIPALIPTYASQFFPNKQQYEKHRYYCEECNTGFTKNSSLKRHMKKHLGIYPHQCDWKKDDNSEICGRKFREREALKRHYRSHTGERPYPCSLCTKRFADKVNLNKHTFSAHGLD